MRLQADRPTPRDLKYVHPPRRESIGARSEPYGPAEVVVYDADGKVAARALTEVTNWCWVSGLAPDSPDQSALCSCS